jgi:hypothetical protein
LLPARSTPRDPAETLGGYLHGCQRLRKLGATVTVADLDPADVATWDGNTRTVTLRETAPLEDLTFAVGELWKLLAIGPAASTAVPARPALRIVR